MKIYNEIVFDVDGNVTYEDSYEYSGDVILCEKDPLKVWPGNPNNAYDIDGNKSINSADATIADQIGATSIADGIRGLLSTGTATTDFSSAIQEAPSMATGEDLMSVIADVKGTDIDVAGEKARANELLMQSTGALTANPMPSMPSISNVGAAPFSGSINWNAIPGGFQPLPQVAGNKKRLYQLSKFHGGINQKSSPRDISDAECQKAINVTVSQVGRIKLLGDIKSTSSTVSTANLNDTGIPSPGYGLYVFKSGYSLASTPIQGDYAINVTQDGGVTQAYDGTDAVIMTISDFTDSTCDYNHTGGSPRVVAHDANARIVAGLSVSGTGVAADATIASIDSTTQFTLSADTTATATNGTLTFTAHTHVAPVFYASGNGLYACDANLIHTGTRKVAMLVYREDINRTVTIKGWEMGEALITSPDYGTGTDQVSFVNTAGDEADAGSMKVIAIPKDTGNGNWGSSSGIVYSFYASYLFDNGCETGLSFIGTDTCTDEKLDFNVSINHANGAELGGDKRIHGARIYFREAGSVERYLLAEISLPDGVKGALDSTFTPWNASGTNIYDMGSDATTPVHMTFNSPPELYTYVALNGYYANEMYSSEIDDGAYAPVPHEVRYRTATVGSNGAVFIGCYMFRGKVFADGMMYSMKNKPGVFPELNVFDSPSSDGTPITVLVSFKDKILQFKQDAMYVVNISNPTQFYTEASFRNCGVMNPCQTFVTPFGVIFANYIGCFIYDGAKVISLTSGKLTITNWGISEGSVVDTAAASKDALKVPCVGYDPRSQSIIVLKDIGDDADKDVSPYHADEAWVYHMGTQSWTEGTEMITNENGNRHTNFIISPNGYLSIQQDQLEALKTYNTIGDPSTSYAATQTITYWTKDLDFGLPSQTKRLFKVYITYKGDADQLTCAYGVDGETDNINDLYHFATDSYGGTTSTTPLIDADDGSGETYEKWTVAELYPDNAAEGKGWKSISLYFNGEVDDTFEIQDISILYRPRPIK